MKLLFPRKLFPRKLFSRKLRRLGLCLWAGLWVSFSSFTHASFAQISEPSATLCAPHNFEQQADVIILGKLPNASYVVIVPLNGNTELLSEVRQCVADAFQTESRLGKYIQAGAFAQRSAAHQLTRQLYSLGLDARTIYSP